MARRLLALALVLGVAGLAASAASARGGHVMFPSKCTNEAYKPKGIVVACADNGIFTRKMKWRRWTHEEAEGKGIAHVNTCRPSCAAGHFKKSRAEVKLSKPKRCGKVRQFTKLRIRFERAVPGPQRQTFPFNCA